jgi:hypothetical protein
MRGKLDARALLPDAAGKDGLLHGLLLHNDLLLDDPICLQPTKRAQEKNAESKERAQSQRGREDCGELRGRGSLSLLLLLSKKDFWRAFCNHRPSIIIILTMMMIMMMYSAYKEQGKLYKENYTMMIMMTMMRVADSGADTTPKLQGFARDAIARRLSRLSSKMLIPVFANVNEHEQI